MREFRLPDLGEGMQEAEIRRWLVKPGDSIKLDQPMVEVETDKAVVEIPSPVNGVIAEICVQEGVVAKLGEVLVTFEASASGNTNTVAASQSTPAPATKTSTAATQQHGVHSRQRVLAAPAVRKRAFELDIDLSQVPASQPNGRVSMEDVLTFAQQRKTGTAVEAIAPPSDQVSAHNENGASATSRQQAISSETTSAEKRQALSGLRRRIAERMERSWRTIPHATAFDEVDGTELVALRQRLKPIAEQRGIRLTYLPLLIKLLLPVLKEFPLFNASFDEETREVVYKSVYHIGIAADSPEGLLVPVLRNADHMTLLQIAQQLEHLIEGAQNRKLTLQEAAGSTFTLNNVGSYGGGAGTPIINYPEVAILAVGRLQEKAIVEKGAIVVRPMMPIALSFDHRLIDGALSGKFLARFKELVAYPQQLMLDML